RGDHTLAIAEKTLYTFPGPPDAISPEWPGTPIGAKNTVTRTKGRTAMHDKTVDTKPGLFKRLLANAVENIATSGQRTYSHDGVHSIHGAVVTKDGKGVLYIAPTGTGKSTSTYGLMEFPNTRFHSDDWVYVRYAYKTKDGKTISPMRILDGGEEVARGYQTYRWLEDHRSSDATVVGRGLDDREVTASARELDVDHPEAYA